MALTLDPQPTAQQCPYSVVENSLWEHRETDIWHSHGIQQRMRNTWNRVNKTRARPGRVERERARVIQSKKQAKSGEIHHKVRSSDLSDGLSQQKGRSMCIHVFARAMSPALTATESKSLLQFSALDYSVMRPGLAVSCTMTLSCRETPRRLQAVSMSSSPVRKST